MNALLVKKVLSTIFSVSGLFFSIEQYLLSNKAFILMYHRILEPDISQSFYIQPGMFVSPTSFTKQIAFLKDQYEVVFLEDLVKMVTNGENIGGHCAITFDDGWRDNFTDAFPVLKKYCIPATIFLATGFVGRDRMFWPEEVCYYLERNMVNKSAFDDHAPSSYIRFRKEISTNNECLRETFFDRSIKILKGYSPGDREEILEYFRGMLKIEPFPRQMLSWDEARKMFASGLVRFGAHTVNHEMLDQVSLQKARDEISESREEIEHNLGGKVSTFAYPNGNYTESVRNILAESGFDVAVTTRKGFLAQSIPLMEVPRIAIHEDVSNTIPMFRSRILLRKF
jgi:peptidoglycan/xylan/chitin deacetylase (PgdA/CDA1 family)